MNLTIDQIRKVIPSEIAAELASVQPMDEAGKAFKQLYDLLAANPDKVLVITGGEGT